MAADHRRDPFIISPEPPAFDSARSARIVAGPAPPRRISNRVCVPVILASMVEDALRLSPHEVREITHADLDLAGVDGAGDGHGLNAEAGSDHGLVPKDLDPTTTGPDLHDPAGTVEVVNFRRNELDADQPPGAVLCDLHQAGDGADRGPVRCGRGGWHGWAPWHGS
jgi:hypothetical protein